MSNYKQGCIYSTEQTEITMCVSVGDGRMGHSEEAPYDAIHVGAAAPTVPQAVSFFKSWW